MKKNDSSPPTASSPLNSVAVDARVLFAYSYCIGHIVKIHTIDHCVYDGVLHAISQNLNHLVLKSPRLVSDEEATPNTSSNSSLIIHLSNIAHIYIKNINSLDTLIHNRTNKKGFQTDTAISGASSSIRERPLEPWCPDTHVDPNATGNQPSPNLELGDARSLRNWDQFKTNETKFGLSTDYEDELYTTKLDRSHPDFAARERQAERIAKQIERSSTHNNMHVLEERNQLPHSMSANEEDRFGAVTRKRSSQFENPTKSSTALFNHLNSQLANVRPPQPHPGYRNETRQRTTSHSSTGAAGRKPAPPSSTDPASLNSATHFLPAPIPPYRDKPAVSLSKMKSAASDYVQLMKSLPVKNIQPDANAVPEKLDENTETMAQPTKKSDWSTFHKLVNAMPVLHSFDTKPYPAPWHNHFSHIPGGSRLMSPSVYMAAMSSAHASRNAPFRAQQHAPATKHAASTAKTATIHTPVTKTIPAAVSNNTPTQKPSNNTGAKLPANATPSKVPAPLPPSKFLTARPTARPVQASPTSLDQVAAAVAEEKRLNKRAVIEQLMQASKSMNSIIKHLPPPPKDLVELMNVDLAKQRLQSKSSSGVPDKPVPVAATKKGHSDKGQPPASRASPKTDAPAKAAEERPAVAKATSPRVPSPTKSGLGSSVSPTSQQFDKDSKKKFSFNLSAALFVPTISPPPPTVSADTSEVRKVTSGFFAGKELLLSPFSFKESMPVFSKLPPVLSSSPESITWSFNPDRRSYKHDAHGDGVPMNIVPSPYYYYQQMPPPHVPHSAGGNNSPGAMAGGFGQQPQHANRQSYPPPLQHHLGSAQAAPQGGQYIALPPGTVFPGMMQAGSAYVPVIPISNGQVMPVANSTGTNPSNGAMAPQGMAMMTSSGQQIYAVIPHYPPASGTNNAVGGAAQQSGNAHPIHHHLPPQPSSSAPGSTPAPMLIQSPPPPMQQQVPPPHGIQMVHGPHGMHPMQQAGTNSGTSGVYPVPPGMIPMMSPPHYLGGGGLQQQGSANSSFSNSGSAPQHANIHFYNAHHQSMVPMQQHYHAHHQPPQQQQMTNAQPMHNSSNSQQHSSGAGGSGNGSVSID